MRNWNYIPENTFSLSLAADARLGSTDFTNDQIWAVTVGNSDPPALSLETTFGLRARLCRIFPRFIHHDHIVTDPKQFSHPIQIRRYYPNYIELIFKPTPSINANLEFWVPSSHVITSRIQLTNSSNDDYEIELEWAELLLPASDGSRMTSQDIGLTTLLVGKTSDISPVLFVTGGAQAGKSTYPSLCLSYTIPAKGSKQAQWAHAVLDDVESSYKAARDVISLDWNVEIAKIQRINSKMIEIYTGNKDWDSIFYLSQVIAYQLFLQPTSDLKKPSFVLSRRPDYGYSFRKDGSDYNYLWNGQSSFDTFYLMHFLLPANPELLRGLLQNLLDSRNSNNEIDWKPGLGGQRSNLLASPVLSEIAYKLFEVTRDNEYIQASFPQLLDFFFSWFSQVHDRDGDQIPEWDQLVQAGFEDHPVFARNHPWSSGVDISTVESPALVSLLYNECRLLMQLAEVIKNEAAHNKLKICHDELLAMIEQAWSDQHACFMYRDRDSHISAPGLYIGTQQGAGVFEVNKAYDPPIRPLLHFESGNEITQPCQIFIHGNGITGTHRVENISAIQIRWHHGHAFVTSSYTYTSIDRIIFEGIRPGDTVWIGTVGISTLDLSLMLPLWAGISSDERAKILINLTLMNKKKFLCSNGLRSFFSHNEAKDHPDELNGINLPWISLTLEGLVRYREREKAAEIFTRVMKPVLRSFNQDMTLHQSYDCATGKVLGSKNTLTSLIPIGVFLKILGVNIITPYKVEIEGQNPFPWPVTVKFRGLTIIKHQKKTMLIMPDGENITINNGHRQVITSDQPH